MDTNIRVQSKDEPLNLAAVDETLRPSLMDKDTMMTRTAGHSSVHRPLQLLTWMEGFICRLQTSIPELLGCLTSISPPQPLLICPPADYACSLEGAGLAARAAVSVQCVHTAAASPGFHFHRLIARTLLSAYLPPAFPTLAQLLRSAAAAAPADV